MSSQNPRPPAPRGYLPGTNSRMQKIDRLLDETGRYESQMTSPGYAQYMSDAAAKARQTHHNLLSQRNFVNGQMIGDPRRLLPYSGDVRKLSKELYDAVEENNSNMKHSSDEVIEAHRLADQQSQLSDPAGPSWSRQSFPTGNNDPTSTVASGSSGPRSSQSSEGSGNPNLAGPSTAMYYPPTGYSSAGGYDANLNPVHNYNRPDRMQREPYNNIRPQSTLDDDPMEKWKKYTFGGQHVESHSAEDSEEEANN